MSFAGKTAVVTGAGGGMGLTIAQGLLAQGAQVLMIDLIAAPEGLSELPGQVYFRQGDVTDDAFVKNSLDEVFETTGQLDYLVNAAGVLWFGRDKSLVETDLDLWDEILRINLRSMVHTARHAVPHMKASGGGAMVHISSIQALRGDDKPQDAYQAAKAAMLSLSKSLAIQFAADGIRSNCILPGGTHSPMQTRWDKDPQLLKAAAAAVPLGRIGTTQDMANAVLFLLSDQANFITGTQLVVDGGITAKP